MFRGLVFAGLLALAPSFAWAQQPCSTDARHVVDELYRHMLERTADAGSQGWVDRLNQGMTVRELVALGRTPFLHLLLGHRTLEELDYAFADCQANSDEARATAEVAEAVRFLDERADRGEGGLAAIGFSLGAYYALERRWPDAPFWQRRHQVITLDPNQPLHFSTQELPEREFARMATRLASEQVQLLAELCAVPRPASEVVTEFHLRTWHVYPDRNVVLTLQDLVTAGVLLPTPISQKRIQGGVC